MTRPFAKLASAVLLTAMASAAPLARADFSNAFFVDSPDYTRNGSTVFDFGQRLTTDADQAGSFWHNNKQNVASGFTTTFRFRIAQGPTIGLTGDGFAFVLQDSTTGLAALGEGGSGIGYTGIDRSIAVEFDTFVFDGEFPTGHVSVQTRGNDVNSSDDGSSIGHAVLSDFGFDITDGRDYTCVVEYVPPHDDGDGPIPGAMSVYLNETLVLTVTVDLASIGGNQDNITDENGEMYAGFTGSTGLADSIQVIGDFAFKDNTGGGCVSPYWHVTGWGAGGVGSCGSVGTQFVGTRPATFQWFRNGNEITDDQGGRITGLGTDTIQICNLTVADDGYYFVRVTNACGSADSYEFASIQVCPADYNLDGDINPDDLGDFITCYFSEPPCDRADFNHDNDVNPDDLGDFITTYFGPPCE